MSVLRLREILLPATGVLALAPSIACAPAVASMTMPNPARATARVQATQSYELPPFKEEHRYEVTLATWTPSTLGFRVRFLNAEGCGRPSSYFFSLVDDLGRRYPYHERGTERPIPRSGPSGARLFETTVDGNVDVAVNGSTHYVILEVRPKADRACTALDFRWDFKG